MPTITLHKNARTTPAIRREIRESSLSVRELAKKFNVTSDTIYKWKKRETFEDLSHRRHTTLSSLTEVEEDIVGELREKLGLSLDDITEVMHRCVNPKLSRSAIYRTLRRRGIRKKETQPSSEVSRGIFEDAPTCGYIHMDVKYLPKLEGRRSYLYVAIDRKTRYVYAEVLYRLDDQTSSGFVQRFLQQFPYPVIQILTDNGFEWTDRCAGSVKEKPTGRHAVDQVCEHHKIRHKLTRIRRPQTNGMVERFNRRVNEAIGRQGKIKHNSGKNTFPSHQARNCKGSEFRFRKSPLFEDKLAC